jgi:hypothetical protein
LSPHAESTAFLISAFVKKPALWTSKRLNEKDARSSSSSDCEFYIWKLNNMLIKLIKLHYWVLMEWNGRGGEKSLTRIFHIAIKYFSKVTFPMSHLSRTLNMYSPQLSQDILFTMTNSRILKAPFLYTSIFLKWRKSLSMSHLFKPSSKATSKTR